LKKAEFEAEAKAKAKEEFPRTALPFNPKNSLNFSPFMADEKSNSSMSTVSLNSYLQN